MNKLIFFSFLVALSDEACLEVRLIGFDILDGHSESTIDYICSDWNFFLGNHFTGTTFDKSFKHHLNGFVGQEEAEIR